MRRLLYRKPLFLATDSICNAVTDRKNQGATMTHAYSLLISLAVFSVGCATSSSKPAHGPASASNQSATSTPPLAKQLIMFDSKCGITQPSPMENVASEDQKNVVLPGPDTRHPLSAPAYPPSSLRSGQAGTAYVRALITESGAVAQANLSRSSGFIELDNAALESTRTWHFTPARFNGNAVCMWIAFPIIFKLQESVPAPKEN
jgi:TonB family protein